MSLQEKVSITIAVCKSYRDRLRTTFSFCSVLLLALEGRQN